MTAVGGPASQQERSPMSDELDEAPTEDTPNVETQETAAPGDSGHADEWIPRERYTSLQADHTRKSQILADREAWLKHGQEHFPDAFEQDEPDEYDEPDEQDEPQVVS